jgi:pyruvate,orthophosphate dikinase
LKVRVNIESPEDAEKGAKLGAEGIGLTRTEHMYNTPSRLPVVKELVIARSGEEREKILKKLKPMQKEDFRRIFKVMNDKPVTIRLLDPPIQEFLPAIDDISLEVSILEYKLQKGEDVKEILKEKKNALHLVKLLHESHPMLGMRGCRLGIIMPNLYEAQVEAIIETACELIQDGYQVKPEILIPFIGFKHELLFLKERLTKFAGKIIKSFNVNLDYKLGVMIEVPRSALIADELAEYADFFSFGTNDLTQMTLAFSRMDAEEKFLPKYLEKKVIQNNPFVILDWKGTGKLIKMAIDLGRKTQKDLVCGVSGEHASNVESIDFFHNAGVDYLSCEPSKVPVARLAAAQAKIKFERKKRRNI